MKYFRQDLGKKTSKKSIHSSYSKLDVFLQNQAMKPRSSSLTLNVCDAVLMQMLNVEEENADRRSINIIINDSYNNNNDVNNHVNNNKNDDSNIESERITNEADLGEKREEKGEEVEEEEE